jgi:hypothetical protein
MSGNAHFFFSFQRDQVNFHGGITGAKALSQGLNLRQKN